MARLVAGLATSHLAMVLRDSPVSDHEKVVRFRNGFERLARTLDEVAADTLVLVSGEHVNKFFLDNLPAFAIGTAGCYSGPVEDLPIPKRSLLGDVSLAEYMLSSGLDAGIDWARAGQWDLDHGMMVPLHFLDPSGCREIVPVFVNCAAPPYPPIWRCYEVGQQLGKSIAAWDSDRRVAIVACGGLSHSPGDVRMGYIDEEFDRDILDRMANNPSSLAELLEEQVEASGSSSAEVRAWVMAAGAFHEIPWSIVTYEPIPSYGTGCAQAVLLSNGAS